MKRVYFGTDGVRGPYGGPIVNESFAWRLGVAVARWLNGKGPVLIGRDTRQSGAAIEQAFAQGLREGNVEAVSLGVVPTPAVARAVIKQQASLGIVITASHNPATDNGIKIFGPLGVKLTDEEEAAIEREIPATSPSISGLFLIPVLAGAAADYVAVTSSLLRPGALTDWIIVLDTANGATCATSPVVFQQLGAQLVALGNSPDGTNINDGVGSEHPEQLAALVRRTHARMGVAHDGDGDRCLLCDEQGEVLDGDEILTILGLYALHCGSLANQTLVITVQSNLGVDAAIAAAGGRVFRTGVGDRYVIERMLAEGAVLGGESSGHVICAKISPTGDGLVAALKVIEVMLATGRPLSELRRQLRRFPQLTLALPVAEKKPIATLPLLAGMIAQVEAELGHQGRVLVRYSGTEAKLRLLVEGPSNEIVASVMARLEAAARSELDVG